MQNRLLVVDDDGQLTSFLKRFLDKHGYGTQIAPTAAHARRLLARDRFDLIILDLNLPDGDGLEIARETRNQTDTPIIMLTARDEVYDRIVGLEIGADDYVTKPYEPRELLARVKAVLRRFNGHRANGHVQEEDLSSVEFMGLEFDLKQRQLVRSDTGDVIPLTGAEFVLLKAFAENAGAVLTRSVIMDKLYGSSIAVTERAIDAHVTRLRRKIDLDKNRTSLIRAVHGEGYVFAVELQS